MNNDTERAAWLGEDTAELPEPETREDEQLFSASDAVRITGFDATDLQTLLNRQYFTSVTVVQQGERTRRMFTREQLISLLAFDVLIRGGIKPSRAKVYIEAMERYTSRSQFPKGLRAVVFNTFGGGAVDFVQHGDSMDTLLSKCSGFGGILFDYASAKQHIENEGALIRRVTREVAG